MTQLFANNAVSKLDGGIAAATTAIAVTPGDGTKFPTPAGSDFFLATLFQRVDGQEVHHEVVKCTARVGDVLTVQRAQENSTARNFDSGDPIEIRWTAAGDSNKLNLAQVHAAILSF